MLGQERFLGPGQLSLPAGPCLAVESKALIPGLALLSCGTSGSILTEARTNFKSNNSCESFFFNFGFIYLFIYLFIYGCVGSSFLCEGFL